MANNDKTPLLEKPTSTSGALIFQAALCLIVVLLLLRYLQMWSSYPYYFMWDMDLVTVTDSVLINSSLMPDHINHTGFGMYLLLTLTQRVTELFHDLSIINLADIAASLNPAAGMAELIDFLRLHSPFVALATVLLLWVAICRLFNPSRWLSLLILAVLGVHEALLYHSAMIRTELYSVFYWSAALALIVLAVKSKRPIVRWLMVLITGLALGLCFLTKIQSLLYVAAAALFFLTIRSLTDEEKPTPPPTGASRWSRWSFTLPLINLAFFICVGFAAYRTEVTPRIGTYESGYGWTAISLITVLALLVLAATQIVLKLCRDLSSPAFIISTLLNVMVTGFLLSFLLHLLIYPDPFQSLKYMLWDFKMVFFRQSDQLNLKTMAHYWRVLRAFMRYDTTPYVILIALTVFLPIARHLRLLKLPRVPAILLPLLALLCLINSAFMSRLWPRDTLWQGTLLNFLNVFLIILLMARCCRYRKLLRTLGATLLTVLLAVNYVHAARMPDRLDANYNHFGWWRNRLFTCVFSGNQLLYRQEMHRPYTSLAAAVSAFQAVDHREHRRLANYVFHNQDITHRNLGTAVKGAPVWAADRNWRILDLPDPLQRALIVDNATLPLQGAGRFVPKHVTEQSEQLDKLLPPAPTSLLAVLTRSDIAVLLFVDKADIAPLTQGHIKPTNFQITVENAQTTRRLHGLLVANYSEFDLQEIKHPFFFVLTVR